VDIANGVDRWVFVGTGRLLDDADLASTAAQTMYAIRDGTATAPKTIAAAVTRSTAGMVAVTSKDPLATKPAAGWYDDLPAGQRIVTPVQAEASIVAYAASRPQTDPCIPGQPATLYAREFSRGGSRLQESGGSFVESIDIDEGAAGIELIALESSSSASGMPDIRLSVTQLKDGTLKTFRISLPALVSKHRMSWRLIRD
jgi:type IV pilus assembly protein PilY1